MSDPLAVDLFVEELAHAVFVGALVKRIAPEEDIALSLQAQSARGGHPRALEMKAGIGLTDRSTL